MKINILLISALTLTIAACDKKPDNATNDTSPSATAVEQQQATLAPPEPTSAASAPIEGTAPITPEMVAGTYETTLPCADCDGIKTILTLTTHGQYTLKEEYLGKGKPVETKGKYEITDNLIDISTAPNNTLRYKYVNGTIKQLNQDGVEISKAESDFADMYVYKKH